MEKLQGQKQELLGCASVGEQGVASLKERVWELESRALEQKKVHCQQENTIKQLEQVRRPSLSRDHPALGWVLTQRDSMKMLQSCLTSAPQQPVAPCHPWNASEKPAPCRSPTLQPSLCCCMSSALATAGSVAHFTEPLPD